MAEREKRSTVQHKDIGASRLLSDTGRYDKNDLATVVRRADEFMFLEGISKYIFSNEGILWLRQAVTEIIPWVAADPPARRKPQGTGGIVGAPTLLDQFIVIPKKKEDADVAEQPDIVMNEDGTMGGGDSDDEFE